MNIASRAIEIGYYRAMMLWMMNDLEWTTEIEEFASWSIEYDLWGKLKLFGDAIIENFITESEAYDGSNGRSDCLNSLPNEFTYTNVENIRSMLGKSTTRRDTQNMINKWKSRGQIILNVETGKYEKAKKQH